MKKEEKLRNVTIRVLDGEGNSIKEYKSMSDTIQSLDEKDLGLAQDMNKFLMGIKLKIILKFAEALYSVKSV